MRRTHAEAWTQNIVRILNEFEFVVIYPSQQKHMSEAGTFEHQSIVWKPTDEVIGRAQLKRFMKQVGIDSWEKLYRHSIDDVEKFTAEVLKFLDIKFDPPYEKLLDTSKGIEWSKWCRGGGLNITAMCIDRWMKTEVAEEPAIIWEGEEGKVEEWSYDALFESVELCAAGLRSKGLTKGDAIGIHLPMMPETVIALLAIGRIGAIAVPVFSGYGADAIASRLQAIGAKALFTCDGFPRRGNNFDAFAIAREVARTCPTVKEVIVVSRLPKKIEFSAFDFSDDENNESFFTNYTDLTKLGRHSLHLSNLEPTGAEDPLIILYTSGTTGKPKGILHTHCGFPIKAAQDMAFGTDVGRGTRISWLTDIGWMMGPWLIYGALINGATICIYDGAPDFPSPDRIWEYCAKHEVEILGVSPTLIRTLATKGDELPKKHDLSSLRAFASTGEPWNPVPWNWLFEKVGDSRLPIINYSGGTEISGGILMGNPLLPIKPCSFPAPCLGIDAAILDEEGEEVSRGAVGELAIRKPWIGMARGFWQEPERYLETYWSRFEKIWVHGDWAMQDEDGHFYILGRSDDTLKIAGKRVGPAEVESILVAHESVSEAAVIGVPDEIKGTKMIAFCVLRHAGSADVSSASASSDAEKTSAGSLPAPSAKREQRSADILSALSAKREELSSPSGDVAVRMTALQAALQTELRELVAKELGKPLVPAEVHFVSALPKTRNAKVMRRVIRAAFLGEDAGDLSALENPKVVEEIRNAK